MSRWHQINARSALPIVAGMVGLGALALLLGALAFEHWGDLAPCPLCLAQRGPVTAAAIIAAFAAFIARLAPNDARILLVIASLILLTGAGYALYHSGIERHWWTGPEGCSGRFTMPSDPADLMKSLPGAHIVRCDAILFAFLGLSLANWNVILSTGLAVLAGFAAWRSPDE